MQEDFHVFQGIKRDHHPIKQETQFLWDAHNIRLTTRDGDTMMSITNERSTKEIMTFASGETYIGHAILGKYLVLFTKTGTTDTIYRIDMSTTPPNKVILYKGNLNLSIEHPIQAIADYEAELVQKVYWVDGLNTPRVINIAKAELMYPEESDRQDKYDATKGYSDLYKEAPFGFVQDLELNEEVSVERLSSSVGSFPSGVVQYALTYCYKYGQESNIFYTSELLYTSFADRGGSPEDKISTAFKLTLKNIDTKFQYIRVYSIMRTSIDAVPTVKRVMDVDISDYTSGDIVIVDNNTTGDIVDPNSLLYVGGKDITAGCITSKDNVLFLGDITYNRKSVYGALKDKLLTPNYQLKDDSGNPIKPTVAARDILVGPSGSEYIYTNQLCKTTSTFKNNETYRLGCRFQYKNGEWSEPVWIDDYEYQFTPSLISSGNSNGIQVGKILANIQGSIVNILKAEGYKKMQPLIVLPSQKDRTVLAQGILCPTVGQVGNRKQGSGAYAQSSWLLRPWASTIDGDGYMGSIPACAHNESLAFGAERCVELQTMSITSDDSWMYTSTYEDMTSDTGDNAETSYGAFVVDQQIVTMHSPDIEFGDLGNVINSGTNLKVYKVGEVHFDSNKGEIDIQTATPTVDPDAGGFIKRSLSGDGSRSLISGLFYEDAMVDDKGDSGQFQKYMNPRLWMVYMWHRIGSLNNDCVRPDGAGVRTSELRKKSITNLKISNNSMFQTPSVLESLDVQHFDSNEVALTRLKREDATGLTSCVYFGNVDTLVPAYSQYSFVLTNSSMAGLKNPDVPALSGDAITGGETKSFSQLKITATLGTQNSIQGDVTAGTMPYITETTTTITSDVSSSTTTSAGGITGDSDSASDTNSNTTITQTGTKTTTVKIGGKATVDLTIMNGEFTGLVTLNEDVTADDGTTVVPNGYSWTISGKTSYAPSLDYKKGGLFGWGHHHIQWQTVATKFNNPLDVLAASKAEKMSDIGDYIEALKLTKEGVRMKYKSSPHAVISLKSPLSALSGANLYLVELRQEIAEELRYGGKTKEALMSNLWIPAGPAVSIDKGTIEFLWGDTWFQRYDCLKTYPFTFEDQNQVTEIGSFFCETRVNIDGRYDRNRGSTSFSLSPINFNLINPVYSQLNNFFNTRMLDEDYYKVTNYPSQLMWTLAKNPSAIQDEWTNLHTANSMDLDGANGRLINVCPLNDLLVGFQETGFSQILFNSRVQIEASDGVPIEIANSQRVEGARAYSNVIGCQDKFAMITTPEGIYFIDNAKHQIYLFQGNGTIQNLGLQLGSLYWPRDNYSNMTWRYKPTKAGNNGIRLFYDSKFQDVYFTPGKDLSVVDPYDVREALCFSEQLAQFTSLMSYGGSVMFSLDSKFYSIADNEHGVMTLYENFAGNTYNKIFGVIRPFSFSFISNDNPSATKIFDTVEMRTDCYEGTKLLGDKYSTRVQTGQPLDFIRVDNEYQDTGVSYFDASSLRKKFRIWRALIPRNKGTRERIRNTWAKVTLGSNTPGNYMTILHDLAVKYTL